MRSGGHGDAVRNCKYGILIKCIYFFLLFLRYCRCLKTITYWRLVGLVSWQARHQQLTVSRRVQRKSELIFQQGRRRRSTTATTATATATTAATASHPRSRTERNCPQTAVGSRWGDQDSHTWRGFRPEHYG